MEMPGLTLLVVEDDPRLSATLAASFTARGYKVSCAASVGAAEIRLAETVPDRAIVDLKLNDGSGLDVVALLARANPPPRIVVLTGYASIATTVEAIKLGATQYLAKPATAREIEAAFDHEAGRDLPEVSCPGCRRCAPRNGRRSSACWPKPISTSRKPRGVWGCTAALWRAN